MTSNPDFKDTASFDVEYLRYGNGAVFCSIYSISLQQNTDDITKMLVFLGQRS